MFNILQQHGDHWHPMPGHQFEDPQEATRHAQQWTAESGVKHRIQKAPTPTTPDWFAREQRRLDLDTYTAPNWNLAAIPGHYVHMSQKKPGLLAYTESPHKGESDIQTPISVGKYLTRFYSDQLTPAEISDLAARIGGGTGELEILDDSDAIRRAYIDGPNSCMSHDVSSYNSNPHHPVDVYGDDSDISLAVLRRDGSVTARALVWQDKRRHSRIYGDRVRMASLLDAAGYMHGSFGGATLNRLESHNGDVVCPYVDSETSRDGSPDAAQVDDCGDYLTIVTHGDYTASSTEGLLEDEDSHRCESCNDRVSDEDSYYSDATDQTLCEHCYCSQHPVCDSCGNRHHTSDMRITANDDIICPDCIDNYVTCDYCGELHPQDNTQFIESTEEDVCDSCLGDNFTECSECDEYHPDAKVSDDICDDCGIDCDECGTRHPVDEIEEGMCPDCRKTCDVCGEIHAATDTRYTDQGATCPDCRPAPSWIARIFHPTPKGSQPHAN